MSKLELSPVILQNEKGEQIAKALYKKKPSKRCPNPYWKMKIQGQDKHINLGRFPRSEVLSQMKAILSTENQVKKGSVEYLLRGFFNHKRKSGDWSERTIIGNKNDIERIIPIIGQLMLPSLKQKHIDILQDKLIKNYAKRTVNRTISILSSAFNWGRKKGIRIPHLDLKKLKLKKGEYVNNHYTPTEDELEKVFWAIEDKELQQMFLLWWVLGSRSNEILNITWENITYEERTKLYVVQLDGKTGKRNGYLRPTEYELLLQISPKDTGSLFANISTNNASTKIKQICRKLGVNEFTPHGMRRAAANKLFGKVSERVYSEIMGHSTQTFWRNYNDVSEDEKMDALLSVESPISTKPFQEVA